MCLRVMADALPAQQADDNPMGDIGKKISDFFSGLMPKDEPAAPRAGWLKNSGPFCAVRPFASHGPCPSLPPPPASAPAPWPGPTNTSQRHARGDIASVRPLQWLPCVRPQNSKAGGVVSEAEGLYPPLYQASKILVPWVASAKPRPPKPPRPPSSHVRKHAFLSHGRPPTEDVPEGEPAPEGEA